jgi:hypothetical protein
VALKNLKSHHITDFREDRLKDVSSGTVLKDLGLLSAVINTGRTEWGLETLLRNNPVSLISKPKAPRPRDRRLEAGLIALVVGSFLTVLILSEAFRF